MPNTTNQNVEQNNNSNSVPNEQVVQEHNVTDDTTTFINNAVLKTNDTSYVYSLPHDFIKTSYGGVIDQSLTAIS